MENKRIINGIDGPMEVSEPKLKPGERIVSGVEGPIITKDELKDEGTKGESSMETERGQFLQVDRKSPEILEAIADAPIFKKQGRVEARLATAGEEIVTVLEGGAKETVNKANEGDWIVTNPSGEQYIISAAKFLGRYEETDQAGTYSAKGYCRAILNPFGKPIEIMASWGSPQTGNERCMIADTCDASGKVDGEPYLIDADAFDKTYKRAIEE
jgi:hypothetical protein